MTQYRCRVVARVEVVQVFAVSAEGIGEATETAGREARALLPPPPPGLGWHFAQMDVETIDGEGGEYHMTTDSQKLP